MSRKIRLYAIGIASVVIPLIGIVVRSTEPGNTAFAEPSKSPIVLASLNRKQDRVVLDFTSRGCFQNRAYRLEYRPTPSPRLIVSNLLQMGGLISQTAQASAPLATVTLTPEQVKRLDNTLRFFRERRGFGGCTTVDTLGVTLYHRGKESEREVNQDDSCRRSSLEDATPQQLQALRSSSQGKQFPVNVGPILSLDKVVSAAMTANTQGRAVVPYFSSDKQ